MVNKNGVRLTRTVRKTARESWQQSNLEMIVAIPGRKNEDDEKIGERLKGEVVMRDKHCDEKMEVEERVLVPVRVYPKRENLEVLAFTPRCPRFTLYRRRRTEDELRGTKKAAAAQTRVKEYQDCEMPTVERTQIAKTFKVAKKYHKSTFF